MVDPDGRHLDFGHLMIGLDARYDPQFASKVFYPVLGGLKNIDLGGTGTELVTWLGDLGGGAARLASLRSTTPATSAGAVFVGSDYGGSINLEGDVAAFVVANAGATTFTATNISSGKNLSDALQDYLLPSRGGPAWNNRATTFLTMYGANFDAAGNIANRSAVISTFAPKIQTFACNYLASRVKDNKLSVATAKAAANNVIPASQEVAEAFVDALDASHRSGTTIEAKKFQAPKPAQPGACSEQITAAGFLSIF
jgi:hypothetical protein